MFYWPSYVTLSYQRFIHFLLLQINKGIHDKDRKISPHIVFMKRLPEESLCYVTLKAIAYHFLCVQCYRYVSYKLTWISGPVLPCSYFFCVEYHKKDI